MRSIAMRMVLTACLIWPAAAPLYAEEPVPATPVAAEVGADGVQRAALTLDSYSYAPAHLIVQAGKPVDLTLTSVTTIVPHNFVLNDPASGLNLSQDVSAGKTVKITFTPVQAGTFAFFCDRKLPLFPSHREKGMEGKLDVR